MEVTGLTIIHIVLLSSVKPITSFNPVFESQWQLLSLRQKPKTLCATKDRLSHGRAQTDDLKLQVNHHVHTQYHFRGSVMPCGDYSTMMLMVEGR